MNVIYPAIFFEEKEGGYSVFVPDLEKALNCSAATCGDDLEDAMYMAQDLIAGLIIDEIDEGHKIPRASKIEDIDVDQYEKELDFENWDYASKFKSYVFVDITSFSKKWDNTLVKKTVNIPRWLNTQGERQKINFSKTLEEALLQKLYIDE